MADRDPIDDLFPTVVALVVIAIVVLSLSKWVNWP